MTIQPPSLQEEKLLWAAGAHCIAGIDEAGRGPWAGPVVAAAVVLPADIDESGLQGLLDSKALTAQKREMWYERLPALAWQIGVGESSAQIIDKYGIVPATKKAILQALSQLAHPADAHLLDALEFAEEDARLTTNATTRALAQLLKQQQAFIKGEQVSYSIAAASVIAKVTRDRLLIALDQQYPNYGFAQHKGYGTKAHLQALLRFGPCPLHRSSFKPIQRLLQIGL